MTILFFYLIHYCPIKSNDNSSKNLFSSQVINSSPLEPLDLQVKTMSTTKVSMLTSEVSMTPLVTQLSPDVNLELLKKYDNELVSQNIISKMGKVRSQHEENQVVPLQDVLTPQSPKHPSNFKKPYAVPPHPQQKQAFKRSANKLSRQIQDELWFQINHPEIDLQRNKTIERQQVNHTPQSQVKLPAFSTAFSAAEIQQRNNKDMTENHEGN